jgi:hypothetical protein
MADEKILQLIVKVLTVGGQSIDHRHLIPSDEKEASRAIDKLANMIMRAMAPKSSVLVWFDNPLIVYNPDNIIGIRTELVGTEQEKLAMGTQVKSKLRLI